MNHYKKFDWGAGEMKSAYGLNQRNRKDAYDGDENTVSPYDDLQQYKKFDWGQDGLAQKTSIDSFL